ncbi:MAG: hypothetical protein ACLFWH_14045 [Actinomycetota bacterium]
MLEELQTLVGVLGHPGFQIGLMAGLVGVGVLLVVTLALRRPIPGWGLVFAFAVGSGLLVQQKFELNSFGALTLLAISGLLVDVVFHFARSRIGDVAKALVWPIVVVGCGSHC